MRPTEASSRPTPCPRVVGLCKAAVAAAGVPLAQFTPGERAILAHDGAEVEITEAALRVGISGGHDLLGDLFCELRPAEERRPQGATYTPRAVVAAMLAWASEQRPIARVVDAGAGSGRFAVQAAHTFSDAEIVAVEMDPVAAILLRANIHAAGAQDRVHVVVGDYRELKLDASTGRTLWTGNPPYVRHHQIDSTWKTWLTMTARVRNLPVSQLAGLHVHFYLATAGMAAAGDVGCFITSAEWLDVNYGQLLRELLVGDLGLTALHVVEPKAATFADATTTAAIACFEVGKIPAKIRLRQVDSAAGLAPLSAGHAIHRERLVEARRWTPLLRATPKLPDGYVELGELCRVHRGAVTGSNRTWVVQADTTQLPESVLYPTVTRARELFAAGVALQQDAALRRVVDLPADLDELPADQLKIVERFLRKAKKAGVNEGYVARYRRAWWSVGLRPAAPILATYMARRPPAFVRNLAEARHINIAHGLYPRVELDSHQLDALAALLRSSVSLTQGRTYAGGLTKFEPREMERLPVPLPADLV
jgi:adenine-specific DNA-methyltransferase